FPDINNRSTNNDVFCTFPFSPCVIIVVVVDVDVDDNDDNIVDLSISPCDDSSNNVLDFSTAIISNLLHVIFVACNGKFIDVGYV
uniref:Ovule protein n=1 Tax=Schistosoma curassoni TaxID=6186 RepID=A0A183JIK4_9TREM